MPTGNVNTADTNDRNRVAAMWALLTTAVNDLSSSDTEINRDNFRRFLLHVAWHEGSFLKQRVQQPTSPSRPGRSFFQFEPLRAKEAVLYAQQLESSRGLLTKLAQVSGKTKDELKTSANAINTVWPAGNLLEDLLSGGQANDLFASYLARIAFMQIPEAIGYTLSAHAAYWAKYWKRVFNPPSDQVVLEKRFQQEATTVDALISRLPQMLAITPGVSAAALREEAAYLRRFSRQLDAAARRLDAQSL